LAEKEMNISKSQRHNWHLRDIAVIMIFAVLCITIVFYYWIDRTIQEPKRLVSQFHASILSLIDKCPSNMTKDQWEHAVHCTNHLPGECLLPGSANMDDLRRFQRELQERVKGNADMNLIFWIWDESAKMSPAGMRYKQRFQKEMLDEMQMISEGKLYIHWGNPEDARDSPEKLPDFRTNSR
jgi:hypothetical protein